MKIAYAVSAVRSRQRCVSWLIEENIGEQLRVYWDDPPSGNAWNNYRNALNDAGSGGEDVLVVMDDDCWPCIDFLDILPRALDNCPGEFASFYVGGTKSATAAQEIGASWISTTGIIHGICWAIPVQLAPEIVRVADELVPKDYPSGDQRLLSWLIATGRRNFISVPNLVNHRRDEASVMDVKLGKANAQRRSACYHPHPIDVEWDATKVYVEERYTALMTAHRLAGRGALTVTPEQLVAYHLVPQPNPRYREMLAAKGA